jgi:radical SAM superfamily enzyme YgiQ (UPF0313 family)
MRWRKPSHRKTLLLVFPRGSDTVTSNDAFFPFPFLSLTQIAALIPAKYKTRIVDERVKRVSGNENAAIVFITALTSNVQRAYELAALFKKRNVPVVLGGAHVTMMPEEASKFVDTVVVGEAENLIADILADFETGALKPIYRCREMPVLDHTPPPGIHLLNWRHRFFMTPIQTSRGCPNTCDFCAVPTIFGRNVRIKSLATLEKELKYLSRFRTRRMFVVDDNFTIKKDRALALMDLFRHYGFRWMGFSTLSVSEDEAFLKALKKSGCVSLFIGFESIDGQPGLIKNRSYPNSEKMRKAVRRIHDHHIGIQGSFIFGFDDDDATIFQKTVSFIQETGIELPNICILTPFPGTPLFKSLDAENRIRHRNWSQYDMNHVVFEPKNMTAEELLQGYAWSLKYLAAPTSIVSRLKRRFSSTPYFLIANFSLHRAQTRLAHSLWNTTIQKSLEERQLCPC